MKIIISGLGKSGTTALFFKLKHAMPPETYCMFEPSRFEVSTAGPTHVLAKVLIARDKPADFDSFSDFDRKIMIVRDARDVLVSRVLYDIYNDATLCRDDAGVDALVNLLRRKEAAPSSVPLHEIIDLVDRMSSRGLLARATQAATIALDFQRRYPNYFQFRYEEFVRANFTAIESHLEFALAQGAVSVPVEYARVARTKGYGDWRNWMTASDVRFFRPYLEAFLDVNGYSDDWTLPDEPRILPEHGSDYVLRLVRERRHMT
jgi:hypothetical protein